MSHICCDMKSCWESLLIKSILSGEIQHVFSKIKEFMFRAWIFHVQLAVEQCASKWGEGVARACWLEGGEGGGGGGSLWDNRQVGWGGLRGGRDSMGREGGGTFVPLWKRKTYIWICGQGHRRWVDLDRHSKVIIQNDESWGGGDGDSDEDVGDEDAQCWWVGVTDWCSDAVAPASSIRPTSHLHPPPPLPLPPPRPPRPHPCPFVPLPPPPSLYSLLVIPFQLLEYQLVSKGGWATHPLQRVFLSRLDHPGVDY